MDTPARLRLYQYDYSPYCIPIELVLRHSGISYDVVTLNAGDPTPIISLTKGQYYQAPVVEDLFNHEVVFDRTPAGDDIPRFILSLAPLMNLFPDEVDGLHRILLHYIEHDCEAAGFKICDAYSDKWLKTDIARGLFRRHKERKFGPGCIEEWLRTVDALTDNFHHVLAPFEKMLGKTPFLTGDRPVFADYALCGVIGNFLYPGGTSLPGNYLMLEAWYTRMRGGNFRGAMDDLNVSHDGAAQVVDEDLLTDVTDLEKALGEMKLRTSSNVLDVATGLGHTAICLAGKGFHVTASDISVPMLQQVATIAAERKLDITLHEHPAEALPYPDGTFSLVTCRLAAHRFTTPESFVREASRVLKMYGYLLMIEAVVPDDHVEAAAWLNSVERLRDPSHIRFLPPSTWRKWCQDCGLTVIRAQMETLKQPDLNHYFDVAKTTPENRRKVLEMVAKAPASVRELFRIGQEGGQIVWYWRRMTLIAGKV